MAYFYWKNGHLRRVPDGERIRGASYLPTSEEEAEKYRKSLQIDIEKAKRGILTKENLLIAMEYKERFPSLLLEEDEYTFVCDELAKHLSDEEKGSPLVFQTLPLKKDGCYYSYTAINLGHRNYVIIRKVLDDLPDAIADIVMEVFNEYTKK